MRRRSGGPRPDWGRRQGASTYARIRAATFVLPPIDGAAGSGGAVQFPNPATEATIGTSTLTSRSGPTPGSSETVDADEPLGGGAAAPCGAAATGRPASRRAGPPPATAWTTRSR
jgi:hypothetical protein